MSRKLLIGHTSPETAFLQPDYPYGRELRCKRRVWVESKPGHGQRFVYQTTNPKKAGEPWNKQHAGTYSTITVMYLDEATGYVEIDGLHMYASAERIEAFVALYGEAALMADPWIAEALPVMRKIAAKMAERERAAKQEG